MSLDMNPGADADTASVTQTALNMAEFDAKTGRFLRNALAKKHDPSTAIAILATLHTPPEFGTPDYDRYVKVAAQLTRNVAAVVGPAKGAV